MEHLLRGNSGFGLPGSNGTESHQEFVVYWAGIVEEQTNNFLNRCLVDII